MNTAENFGYTCVKCSLLYYDYKHLLEHMYWRHGTEGTTCSSCKLKRWHHAVHICGVLPIDDNYVVVFDDMDCLNYSMSDSENSSEYCYCQKDEESPMIGCDGPQCKLKWFHFSCIGIIAPPEGMWFCPECTKTLSAVQCKSRIST